MIVFVHGLDIDRTLLCEIEEKAQAKVSSIVIVPAWHTYEQLKVLVVSSLNATEEAAIVHHVAGGVQPFITAAGLIVVGCGCPATLIAVDGGWDRKAQTFVYHVKRVDRLEV